jgi:hypothetical protein
LLPGAFVFDADNCFYLQIKKRATKVTLS